MINDADEKPKLAKSCIAAGNGKGWEFTIST
jgi:hypothetical protein